jgi:hypothetical protein
VGSNPTGATSPGDVAQRQEQSLVRRKIRRFESGRPRFTPENPARFACHDDFPAFDLGIKATVTADAGKAGIGAWWSWCKGSIRGRDPRGSGSNPDDRPSFLRTLSIGELPAL